VTVTPEALAGLLAEATGGAVVAPPEDPERPLSELPLTSGGWVSFLSLVTERYGHEWDDDTAPEVFASLGSLSRFLAADGAGSAGSGGSGGSGGSADHEAAGR
jgi:hypothetical protein